ncbi:MAG: hypothetical protein QG673_1908 [Pseudomonadota bacterium]|nr:hypothetical protein [Pseudomonadota bacterium]
MSPIYIVGFYALFIQRQILNKNSNIKLRIPILKNVVLQQP